MTADAAAGGAQNRGRVLVTRPAGQSGAVSALLIAAGFEPVIVPTVEIQPVDDLGPLDDALRRIGTYRWAVFSSGNAARLVGERAAALGIPPAAWTGIEIVAGAATARALAALGVRATRTPAPFSAGAALDLLAAERVEGARFFLPRAVEGREEIAAGLRARGAIVDDVPVYRTVPVTESVALLNELERGARAVLFFSPSAVRGFASALQSATTSRVDRALALTVACLGATTAYEARQRGLRVDVIAPDTTTESLVAALSAHMGALREPARQPAGASR